MRKFTLLNDACYLKFVQQIHIGGKQKYIGLNKKRNKSMGLKEKPQEPWRGEQQHFLRIG